MVEDSSLVSCHQCGDKFESKHQLRNHMAGLRHHMMTPYGKQVGEDVQSSDKAMLMFKVVFSLFFNTNQSASSTLY